MKRTTTIWILYYAALLWIAAIVFSSCSFSLVPKGSPNYIPDWVQDTVIVTKTDTIGYNNQKADSLLRVIDSLNEDWHIDEDFKEPENNDLTETVNYWKDQAFTLKAFTKEQAFMIHELKQTVNELKSRPMLKETTTRTVTKPQDNNAVLITGISMIVAFLIGKFFNKKHKDNGNI